MLRALSLPSVSGPSVGSQHTTRVVPLSPHPCGLAVRTRRRRSSMILNRPRASDRLWLAPRGPRHLRPAWRVRTGAVCPDARAARP